MPRAFLVATVAVSAAALKLHRLPGAGVLDVTHEVGVLRQRVEEAEQKIRSGGSDAAGDAVRLLEANRRHFTDLGTSNSSMSERAGAKLPREMLVEANGIMAYSGSMLGQLYAKAPGMQDAAMRELEKACPRLYRMSSGARQSNDNWLSCFAALADLYATQTSVRSADFFQRSEFEAPEDQLRNLLNAHAMQVLGAASKPDQHDALEAAKAAAASFITVHLEELETPEAAAATLRHVLNPTEDTLFTDVVAREGAHYLRILDHIHALGFSFVEAEAQRVRAHLHPLPAPEADGATQVDADLRALGLQTRSEILATMKFLAARLAVNKGAGMSGTDASGRTRASDWKALKGGWLAWAMAALLGILWYLSPTLRAAEGKKRRGRKGSKGFVAMAALWRWIKARGKVVEATPTKGREKSSAKGRQQKSSKARAKQHRQLKGRSASQPEMPTPEPPASLPLIASQSEPLPEERPSTPPVSSSVAEPLSPTTDVDDNDGWETVQRFGRRSSRGESTDAEEGAPREPMKASAHLSAPTAPTPLRPSPRPPTLPPLVESLPAETPYAKGSRVRAWAATFDEDSDGSTSNSASSAASSHRSQPTPTPPPRLVARQGAYGGDNASFGDRHPAESEAAHAEDLSEKIRAQVEYYFSVDNLCKDIYLRRSMDASGYVPLGLVASFNRVQALCGNGTDILAALESSALLEIKLPWSVKVARAGAEAAGSMDKMSPDLCYAAKLRTRENPMQWVLPTPPVTPSPTALSPRLSADSPPMYDPAGLWVPHPQMTLPPYLLPMPEPSPRPAGKRRGLHSRRSRRGMDGRGKGANGAKRSGRGSSATAATSTA